jgi:hypothetical protein
MPRLSRIFPPDLPPISQAPYDIVPRLSWLFPENQPRGDPEHREGEAYRKVVLKDIKDLLDLDE